jgi:SAM-dependent methyltransferase
MKSINHEPRFGTWPDDDIETVSSCPVCNGKQRAVLHELIEDDVFQCAPGQWDLHSCLDCGAAYLNPRPTPASIGRAYASYYTHAGSQSAGIASPIGALATFRRSLRNGYFSRRYGVSFEPASKLGWLVMQLTQGKKKSLDREYRHLTRLRGNGEKVLDIGCGDGGFLRRATELGWDAWGVEPDAKALTRLSGLRVLQGSLPNIPLPDASFDFITLSHVIEHLHDPVAALKEIYRLLKPGGKVWIATPNIESLGHRLFGATWIGIQSPTHLVLFNRRALRHAFASAGFQEVCFMPMHAQARIFLGMSHWLNNGRNPFTETASLPFTLRLKSIVADRIAAVFPQFREEIVATAQKPTQDAGQAQPPK